MYVCALIGIKMSGKDKLTVHDLASLVSLLHDVSSLWESIATALELSENDIRCIQQDWPDRAADRFREVLRKWLTGLEPTRAKLAAALQSPPVSRYDLAQKVLPGLPPRRQVAPSVSPGLYIPVLFAVVLALVHSLSFYYNQSTHYVCSPMTSRRSLSLPDIRGDSFFGREEEMFEIMKFIDHAEIRVVTLFGLAGLGKSTVAMNIGHKMLEMGLDVHYIKVERFANVIDLEKQLMDVSGTTFAGARLMKWARALDRRTLLILDNVDRHWLEKGLRQQFQTTFVEELMQYSPQLEVLITSQQRIEFCKNFNSFHLHPLSVENCVLLANQMAPGSILTESKALCELVGNVPMAIEVLTSMLKSHIYSMNDVIQRLQDMDKKFELFEKTEDNVEERIISAIKIAFDYLKLEYQVCSLLLAKFSYRKDATYEITSKTIKDLGYNHFEIKDCLYELTSKSILEHSSSWSGHYCFHVLIGDFLNSSMAKEKHNMTKLLTIFWKNVLQRPLDIFLSIDDSEDAISMFWYGNITMEDADALTRVLDQDLYTSKRIAARIFAYYIVVASFISHGHIDYLTSKLRQFMSKVEKLQLLGRGDHEVRNVSALFYSTVWLPIDDYSSWKSSLYVAIYSIAVYRESGCLQQGLKHCREVKFPGCRGDRCNVSKALLGMNYYSLMEDEKALDCLLLALQENSNSNSTCDKLRNAVVYITLYDIYSRHSNQQGMEDSITGVTSSTRLGKGVCYSATIYYFMIVTFLSSVGETTNANQLFSMIYKDLADIREDAWGYLYAKMDMNRDFHSLMCKGKRFNW